MYDSIPKIHRSKFVFKYQNRRFFRLSDNFRAKMFSRPSGKADVAEKGRQSREDNMGEIRKKKREEILQKKRRLGQSASIGFGSSAAQDLSSADMFLKKLPHMLGGIHSEDRDSQLKGTNFLRKLLCIARNPPINAIVDIGVVPRMVKFLSADPELQYEAAWVLTNIASETSDNIKVIAQSGALPLFIKLLSSPSASQDVRELAVWALGNVAAESTEYRDHLLNENALIPLICQFVERKKLSMQRIVTWTLANFCRGKPPPSLEQIKPAIPVFERLLQSTDEEVLTDACSALSCLSDDSTDMRQAVIDAGVTPHIIKLLSHSSPSVLVPALRTIGNIVTSGDDIIAGNSNQIQAVIDAGIIQSLVMLLQTAEFEVKKEAAVGISNVTARGTEEQIRFMVSQGCIEPVCNLLTCPEPSIIAVCLEALERILIVGEAEKNLGDNLYASMIDEAKGLEKMEQLQNHDNNDINQKAMKIIGTFWQKTEKATTQF